MPYYFIEGVYQPHKKGKNLPLEPVARSYWADSPQEALRLAEADFKGGRWTSGPKISQKSEEQRMRDLGMPLLPGFDQSMKTRRTPGK